MLKKNQIITVVDCGMGNLHSVVKAVRVAAEMAANTLECKVSNQQRDILAADKIILPGVGAIGDYMAAIRNYHLDKILIEATAIKPLLAICVGMQALLSFSEENNGVHCLDYFAGKVCGFQQVLQADKSSLKIPHMGWNQVMQTQNHPLWRDIPDESYFYFVHSYFATVEQPKWVVGTTTYGISFPVMLVKGNIAAVQFHPEKSQQFGLMLLRNFLTWDQ